MRPFAELPARRGPALLFKNQQPIGVGASVGCPGWVWLCLGVEPGAMRPDWGRKKQEVLAR
jgi:hypothetical protein